MSHIKPKREPGNKEACSLQLKKSTGVKSWSLDLSKSTPCTLWRSFFSILPLPLCYHHVPLDDDRNGQLQLLVEKERGNLENLVSSVYTLTPSKACPGPFCKGLVSLAQWQLFLSSSVFYMLLFYLTLLSVRSNHSFLLRCCFLKGAKDFILQTKKKKPALKKSKREVYSSESKFCFGFNAWKWGSRNGGKYLIWISR